MLRKVGTTTISSNVSADARSLASDVVWYRRRLTKLQHQHQFLPLSILRSNISSFSGPFRLQSTVAHATESQTSPTVSTYTERPHTPTEPFRHRLEAAIRSRDPRKVESLVAVFRATAGHPSVMEYNLALEGLYKTRVPGGSLTTLLEAYNDMYQRGLLPNIDTYSWLLRALVSRDHDVHWAIKTIEARARTRDLSHNLIPDLRKPSDEGAKLVEFRAETSFATAMDIFQVVVSTGLSRQLGADIYADLLSSCAHHRSIDNALRVWTEIERNGLPRTAAHYRSLIETFGLSGDLSRARDIFSDFRTASANDKIQWLQPALALRAQLMVWHIAIDACFHCGDSASALGLFEEMHSRVSSRIDTTSDSDSTNSPASLEFNPHLPPPPSLATYTAIIRGLIKNQDGASALVWFHRCLKSPHPPSDPLQPTLAPTRPDSTLWRVIIEGLTRLGMVDELDQVVKELIERKLSAKDNLALRMVDLLHITFANLNKARQIRQSAAADPELGSATVEAAKSYLDFLQQFRIIHPGLMRNQHLLWEVMYEYVNLGQMTLAIDMLEEVGKTKARVMRPSKLPAYLFDHILSTGKVVSFSDAIRLLRALDKAPHTRQSVAPYVYLWQAYTLSRPLAGISNEEGDFFLNHLVTLCLKCPEHQIPIDFPGLLPVLGDVLRKGEPLITLGQVSLQTGHRLVQAALRLYAADHVKNFAETNLEPSFLRIVQQQVAEPQDEAIVLDPSTSTHPKSHPQVDHDHSDIVEKMVRDALYSKEPSSTLNQAIDVFDRGYEQHRIPTMMVCAQLCAALGRHRDLAGAKRVYLIARSFLDNVGHPDTLSGRVLEDSIIVAHAHSGDLEGANVHRQKLIEKGVAPSGDAYGALVQHTSCGTHEEEAELAWNLFGESRKLGGYANHFFFNNVISKLGRACQVDRALELLDLMEELDIRPSSITYGTIIAAHVRVGNTEAAEAMFVRMIAQDNYKPRASAFHSMLSLFTIRAPNRVKVLYYYDLMQNAGLGPTIPAKKALVMAYDMEPREYGKIVSLYESMAGKPGIINQLATEQILAIIRAYGHSASFEPAMALFESLEGSPEPSVWDTLLEGLTRHNEKEKAQTILNKMKLTQVPVSSRIVSLVEEAGWTDLLS